ncbi:hypothetical protein [Exiguobacterium sp. SH5S13]|uniref:hypothetical protein n=2 Tax=unclassified Exiguobacterium TaxID=2644629 RepID=UPI00103E0ED5|nr:hypothetical protein [Exiguobacterium sp. SH5S13]
MTLPLQSSNVLAAMTAKADGTYKFVVKPLKIRQTVTVISEQGGQTKEESRVVEVAHVGIPALR